MEKKRALLKKALRDKAAKAKTAYPLSHVQKALWFLYKSAPESAAYNMAAVTRIVSRLDVSALRNAFQTLFVRHSALRSTFSFQDGQPVRIVHGDQEVYFEEIDASLDTDEMLHERVWASYRQPFDLEKGPLFRISLFTHAPEDCVLLMVAHHIICDGWSTWLLASESLSLYPLAKVDHAKALPPLKWQYQDFVRWQTELLASPEGERSWEYWREHLADRLPELDLPTDRPRPSVQSYNGATTTFNLSGKLMRELTDRAQASGATLYMIVLAAFQVLLHRYTGQDDIIVGVPTTGRSRGEFEAIVGHFVNTLPLRAKLGEDPPFDSFLSQVRETVVNGLTHQDYPFPLLVERLQPTRDASHSPIFQSLFVMQKSLNDDELSAFLMDAGDEHSRIERGGLSLAPFRMPQQEGQFDLILEMVETKQLLSSAFMYNPDIFDAETIDRMVGHFETLLSGIVAEPSTRVSRLPLLTELERKRILLEWNDTKTPYPQDKCAHELFEEQAREKPDAIAIVFEGEEMRYGELNVRANRLAHRLRALGVGPEVMVGLFMERSAKMIVAVLAILKAGGAYVPLDLEYPKERIAFMAKDADLKVLLCHGATRDRLPECGTRILDLGGEAWEVIEENGNDPAKLAGPDNLAYVIYTSGSTGIPKGVCVEHRAIVRLVRNSNYMDFDETQVFLQSAPIAFDASTFEVWGALINGAKLVVPSPGHLSLEKLGRYLRENNVTTLFLTTALFNLMVQERPGDLANLGYLLCGGEVGSPENMKKAARLLAPGKLLHVYGPTENTTYSTFHLVSPDVDTDRTVPIGGPISNTRIYVLDDRMQPVPAGVTGELYTGGVGVARGYLNRPELTAEKFIPDPFGKEPGARLYRTGDACRWLPDGGIDFLGRIDTQVKIRGFRIECGEVESALLLHPDIREAVVDPRGEGADKRLVAWLVAQTEDQPTLRNALRAHLRESLPDWMLPSVFVFVDSFPLNRNGKIDRRALPDPDTGDISSTTAYIAPRTPLEEGLRGIFTEVLGVERIGIFDDFFDLGGHSLLAVRIMSRITETFAIELPIHALFDSPTIAGIANAIDQARAGTVARETDVDLGAEVVLDAAIAPSSSKPVTTRTIAEPRAILLTGATGFVGSYLLHELLTRTEADVYCLVRAKDFEKGKQRLKDKLESCLIRDQGFESRIIPVIGELSQPLLGLPESRFNELAETIDLIYHNGAWVNHLYPYTVLKAINVLGTQEILRFATRAKIKPVHFISTHALARFQVENGIPAKGQFVNGYIETKWVAEQLLKEARRRGLPVCIYRLDRVTGHSETGVSNEADFLNLLIKGCIQLGKAPLVGNVKEHLTPVDYISRAVVHLSQQSGSLGKTFNLLPPYPSTRWQELFFKRLPTFGYPIKRTLYGTWREELTRQTTNALYPILPIFPESSGIKQMMALLLPFLSARPGKKPVLDEAEDPKDTIRELENAGITCPNIDDQVLKAYFSYFWKSGFLESPRG